MTPEQIEIMKWIIEGVGHAVVIARAGTGKTWTALRGMRLMLPARACIAMFNRPIADETRGKLAADEINGDSVTFHSAGWTALRQAYPKCKLSGTGPQKAGFDKWDRIVEIMATQGNEIPAFYQKFAQKAVSMAKQRAFGLATPRLKDPTIFAHWLKLVEDFDLDGLIPEEIFDLQLEMGNDRDTVIKNGLRHAARALIRSNELLEIVADHDDQIYGPLIKNVQFKVTYDWLIIDEAQDSNPARRLLARKMLRPNGRALFIGDPAQAIYAFTGADNDAMDAIIAEWKATVLKLTTTFRCPKLVVRMAQEFVPDYRAAETNIEGEYHNLSNDDFYKEFAPKLTPDTVVLCRNTAPLVQTAFKLIANNIPCRVIGKEIGGQLVELVNRWKSVKTMTTFKEKLRNYAETQTAKLMEVNKERQADVLNDRVDTVFAVIGGMAADATLNDLKAKIDEMFPKSEKGVEQKKMVRLMTAHRAKGLEEDTVVILGRKELFPSKYATKPEQLVQENNLEYVAITRTKRVLIDVKMAA